MDIYIIMKARESWDNCLGFLEKAEILREVLKNPKTPFVDSRPGPGDPLFRFSPPTQSLITGFLQKRGKLWFFSQN